MEPKIFIILGRAGCGKGTQAKLLKEKFGLIYFSSGEALRNRARINDFTGHKTETTMNTGVLVPSTLIFQLWINRLEEIKQARDANFKGIIFDGSPRILVEAKLLLEALEWYEWNKNIKVLVIDISREEAFNRLTRRRMCKKCGQLIPSVGRYKTLEKCDQCGGELETRSDDTAEAINVRLDLFDKEVVPVIGFFEEKGILVKINGEQSIEDVQKEILEKIS